MPFLGLCEGLLDPPAGRGVDGANTARYGDGMRRTLISLGIALASVFAMFMATGTA
jgi:hypothetical protein